MTDFDSSKHPRNNPTLPGAFSASVQSKADAAVISQLQPDGAGVPIGTPLSPNIRVKGSGSLLSRELALSRIQKAAKLAEKNRTLQKDLTSDLLTHTVGVRFPTATHVVFCADYVGTELLRISDGDNTTLWGVDMDGTVHGSNPETGELDRGVATELQEVLNGYGHLEEATWSNHIVESDQGQYTFNVPQE